MVRSLEHFISFSFIFILYLYGSIQITIQGTIRFFSPFHFNLINIISNQNYSKWIQINILTGELNIQIKMNKNKEVIFAFKM